MLQIKVQVNQYRQRLTGNPIFVYALAGTAEEIQEYRDVQGVNYRESEDATPQPLFFSTVRLKPATKIAKRRDGSSYFAETELLERTVQDKVDTLKALAAFSDMPIQSLVSMALTGAPAAAAQSAPVVSEPAPVVNEPAIIN